MQAKSLQSCLPLCDHVDWGPPGSSIHGILQARILEWVAISSSRGSSRPRDQAHVSYVSSIGRQVLYQYCHLGSPSSNNKLLLVTLLNTNTTITTNNNSY